VSTVVISLVVVGDAVAAVRNVTVGSSGQPATADRKTTYRDRAAVGRSGS